MTDPELTSVISKLKGWAVSHPDIARLFLFGSRASGRHRPDSDLDIAIELASSGRDEPVLAVWLTSVREWRREVERLSPWPVDLQWYDGGGETETVARGIAHSHLVVFDRGGA